MAGTSHANAGDQGSMPARERGGGWNRSHSHPRAAFCSSLGGPGGVMQTDARCLRWVALAVDRKQLHRALAALAGEVGAAQAYPEAAIVRLYADGRQERIRVAQIELVLAPARIPEILRRLANAGVLGTDPDRAPLIRDLDEAGARDCQVFPAPPDAPYAHVVRWRGERKHRPTLELSPTTDATAAVAGAVA